MRGLSIISQDGEQSDLIEGTPRTYDDVSTRSSGLHWGLGWMMDVAIHPDYETNGWIYIQYGDRCSDCNTISRRMQLPVSMNKLVRGRIEDGTWVDEETLWQADMETYGTAPDIVAGGRISFDHSGHVFISVGMKGIDDYTGIQDLNIPWGKIHRLYDDGHVPPDNPFVGVADAMNTIWTYGHRSPQGLEFNLQTGQLWGTEMGPRGGDEVNLLLPGRNYGWPLYSKGVKYDGTPVDYGKRLGIEFELKDIEQPVVDLTPSPAVSSFIFYSGTAFPKWRNNIIVGSLKAGSLYRMVIENNEVVHTEMLLEDLARLRDIETGPSGEIYVLLEHAMGGQIIRLVPSERAGVN
jgi:glucose/arabinose dehydrogenase